MKPIGISHLGFSTAKIRQRLPLLNLSGDPRSSIAEIDAVAAAASAAAAIDRNMQQRRLNSRLSRSTRSG
jgi:hypothetical protein